MKKAIILLAICFSTLNTGFGQQSTDLKEVFLAAESYFLFEEFEEALPLYLKIHRAEPNNYNLCFKIGVCYLNDPYEKAKSIFYLEKASKNINPKYKESNYKELGAPLDALFYLGNAYRVNNILDKARDSYKKFQSQMNTEIYDDALVVEQLTACDIAEKLMKKPVDMDVDILSNGINTRFADKNPAVSGDETKMVFISQLQFYDAVFYSEKKNGEWSSPRNITPELGVDGDVYPTCLSYDGTQLVVYRNDDFIGNLYTSTLVNGLWTPLVKMNDNINTKYWESHASLSRDGKTLYFTSNRKDGFGGLDVYKSAKLSNGDWGTPVNLGPTINTPYNEETPFITENGRKLFFSSYGHYNMGGYDVFMSVLKADSTWATPVNLGYPVNSTDDDVFFCPVKDGEIAYFPVYQETGYGKYDLYRYKVYTADHPRRFDINGSLNYSGLSVNGSEVNISLISQNSGDTLAFVHPDNIGKFVFTIPAGKYSMIFDSKRFEKEIQTLEVSQNTPHSGMTLSSQIKLTPLPVKLSKEEMDRKLILEDSLITVNNGRSVEIKYQAEKGSVVVAEKYLDSVYVRTDTIEVLKRNQSYVFKPKPGVNQIEFTLTDKDGNQVTKTVTVVYPNDDPSNTVLAAEQPVTVPQEAEEKIEKSVPDANLNALLKDLTSQANGSLKNALQNLDLEKENISNTEELFRYLYENAETLGYSKEDVDKLFMDKITKKNLGEFLVNLKNASGGNLHNTINALDLKASNIATPDQAVDYLIRNSQSSGYKPEDVIKALATVGTKGKNDQKSFITSLINSVDEGDLKVYLKALDLSTITEGTPEDFAVSLYRNSLGKSFTEGDVIKALTNLAVERDALAVLKKLTSLAEDGPLKDFLKNIDLQKEGIFTAEQLISHLYSNADLKGYTKEDVDKLLQKYLYNQVSEIDDLRLKMISLTSGNLKDFLEKLDLNENSFGSREEFIDYLKSQAEKNGFTEDDINSVLLKLAYSGNLDSIIKQLSSHAEGNLKKVLDNLDPEKEGITNFDELIRYLLDNSNKYGYSKEDVYKMLTEYTAATDLDYFMKKLIRLADPETKTYLEMLDLKANSIHDRAELIPFLLKEAAEGKINEEKMIRLLLQANEIGVEEALPTLQSRSTGALNKMLNSDKLPLKDFRTAADLYDYLIASSAGNKDIQASDINKLFADYLIDEALNQFLGQLTDHALGNLKEYLQKINLKESGITSVSGLIKLLIDNADANGYTDGTVYRLIEKVLNHAHLKDFVANMREFASPGLARLLDQLDLDKAGIHSIEELMKYFAEHTTEFGYTMDDVWNAILRLVISGEDKARNSSLAEATKTVGTNGIKTTIITGVAGLIGIIVFLLIILAGKKKKQKE
jgi:hypothetical protein